MLFLDCLKSVTTFVLIGSGMFQSSNVLAQSARARSPQMNVRPSGGGQALLNPSDTATLAKLATLFKIPIITTASEPGGTNGPLMHELVEAAANAIYVPRKGEVNACVMFPALDAKAAGFKVYAVTDASGDPTLLASATSIARFAQPGVIPISTDAVLREVHRTWNRPEAAEVAKLYSLVSAHYAAVAESHQTAQEAVRRAQ